MLRLALYLIQENPSVNEVRFRADEAPNPAVDTRLYASAGQLRQTVREFMNAKASSKPTSDVRSRRPTDKESARVRRKRNRNRRASVAGPRGGARPGRRPGRARRPEAELPVLLPDAAHHRRRLRGHRAAHLHDPRRAGQAPRGLPARALQGLVGEYYGVQGMTWKDPPILDGPDEIAHGQRAQAAAVLRRPAAAAGRVEDAAGGVLGLQHALAVAQPAADAGHRRVADAAQAVAGASLGCPPSRCPTSTTGSPSGSSAPATSASSPRPASPSSATRSGASTSTRRRSRACARARIPIWEPGLEELVARHRDRLHFSTDLARRARARAAAVRRGRDAADLLRRRRPVRRARGRRRDARVRPARAGDEVDRAGRHRRGDQAHLRRARQGRLLLRLLPGVPQGGLGGQGLPEPRPRRRRRRRRLGRRRRRRPVRAARRAARAHRHQERRDGQARLQRLPGHEDLVHQRDRQRVRGDRRRRRRGRARDGARRPHRAEVPAGRHRLRRARASRRTSPRSSSWPATRATTSSCSTPSSRSTSCRSGA